MVSSIGARRVRGVARRLVRHQRPVAILGPGPHFQPTIWTTNPAELAVYPFSGPASLTPSVVTALPDGPDASYEGQSLGPVKPSWLDLNQSQAHVPAGRTAGQLTEPLLGVGKP